MQELTRSEFLRKFRTEWDIGQHVTIIGTTGSGKTVLAGQVYGLREYVVVVATKSSDRSLDDYDSSFHRVKKWDPQWFQKRILFWKRPDKLGDFTEQREAVFDVMDDVYTHGHRTMGWDDVVYMVRQLRLGGEIQMMCTQSRSQDISLVANLQRPAWVPLEVCNQATHLLMFGVKDKDDVDRIAEAQGIQKDEVRSAVGALNKYDFAWIRTGVEPVIVRNDKE